MKFPTLYGKSSTGSLLLWGCFTTDEKVTVRHGQLNGKITEKTTVSKEKFVGQSNYRNASTQAAFEAEAKWVKQKKKGYYETKEEALDHVERTPMKLANYKDHGHKISFPCYYQTKLNGMRYMVEPDGSGMSKQGEEIHLPSHIQEQMDILVSAYGKGFKGLDGEVYAGNMHRGGLSLQRIISAFRKENEDTHRLQYWIYNIPDATESFQQRLEVMRQIKTIVVENNLKNIVVLETVFCASESEVDILYNYDVEMQEEGGVIHNANAVYEFGKRSYNAQKRKPRATTEAKVISSVIDKNGQGVLTCKLENGVQFSCLMLKEADKDINLRLYENSLTLIDKFIEIEFEEFSDDGVPLKPTGVRVRKVKSDTWEASE